MNSAINIKFALDNIAQTKDFAQILALSLPQASSENPFIIGLVGDLGAGKSSLSRFLIRSLGHLGEVPSPSYSLVESYQLDQVTIHHLDLYRMSSIEELEYVGWYDLLIPNSIHLIEWPSKVGMTQFDLMIHLEQGKNQGYFNLSEEEQEIGNQRFIQLEFNPIHQNLKDQIEQLVQMYNIQQLI